MNTTKRIKTHITATISPEAGIFLKHIQSKTDWPIQTSWIIERAIWVLASTEKYDGPRPEPRRSKRVMRLAEKTKELALSLAMEDV